jgi:hypothetical protein
VGLSVSGKGIIMTQPPKLEYKRPEMVTPLRTGDYAIATIRAVLVFGIVWVTLWMLLPVFVRRFRDDSAFWVVMAISVPLGLGAAAWSYCAAIKRARERRQLFPDTTDWFSA